MTRQESLSACADGGARGLAGLEGGGARQPRGTVRSILCVCFFSVTCFFLRLALVDGMGQGSWVVVCGVGFALGSEMGRGSGGLLEGFRFGARLIGKGGGGRGERGVRRVGGRPSAVNGCLFGHLNLSDLDTAGFGTVVRTTAPSQ